MILNKLTVEEGKSAEGVINLQKDAWFFGCHFPDNPILPGFLLLESMGQVLLSSFISQTNREDGQVPLMVEVRDVHFEGFCVPGDKVIIRAELNRFKYGTARGQVTAYKDSISEDSIVASVRIGYAIPSVLNKQ